MARRNGYTQNNQLCWTCANAVPDSKHGCAWSRDLLPVKGWTAKKRRNAEFTTYKITACPEYVKDTPQTKQEADEEMVRLLIETRAEVRAGHKQGNHWEDHHNFERGEDIGKVRKWDGAVSFEDEADRMTMEMTLYKL
jgi:hypothetical protein